MYRVTTQMLFGLGGAAAVLYVGYVLGMAGAIRRQDRDMKTMQHQAEVQLQFAEQQFRAHREAERERHLRSRTEDAYDVLGRWLHDVDRAIDEV